MFLVIDTWNGEGYSSNNGVDARLFNDRFEAIKAATNWAMEASNNLFDTSFEGFELTIDTDLDAEIDSPIYKAIFTDDDDAGSYQVFEVNDNVVAAMISVNINEVQLVLKDELDDLIKANNDIALEGDSDYGWETDLEGGSNYWWETDDMDYQMVYLKEVPRELDENQLHYVDTIEEGEAETWAHEVDGKAYRVPVEIKRDFNNATEI